MIKRTTKSYLPSPRETTPASSSLPPARHGQWHDQSGGGRARRILCFTPYEPKQISLQDLCMDGTNPSRHVFPITSHHERKKRPHHLKMGAKASQQPPRAANESRGGGAGKLKGPMGQGPGRERGQSLAGWGPSFASSKLVEAEAEPG